MTILGGDPRNVPLDGGAGTARAGTARRVVGGPMLARSNPRFWSDDLDMDLPRVLPDLDEVLGDTADIRLWTFGGTSYGRLNHPSVWNGYTGFSAFYGTDDSGSWKPAGYVTHHELVECTWREALRDAWPHTYLLYVDNVPVWDTGELWTTFSALMHHVRGWRKLPPGRNGDLRMEVRESLRAAVERLREAAALWAGGGR